MLAGRAVMANWCDVAEADRPDYYHWHGTEHMVGRVAIPGFRRGRRYIALEADRDFFNFYEVEDLDVLTGTGYRSRANDPSPLTRATTPRIRNSVRALARLRLTLGSGEGGVMLTLRPDPGHDPGPAAAGDLLRFLGEEALPQAAGMPGIAGAHLGVADPAASAVVSVERRGRPTSVPSWFVMIEGISTEALAAAAGGPLAALRLAQYRTPGPVVRGTYQLQLTVSRAA
jgi:hypothetical protein